MQIQTKSQRVQGNSVEKKKKKNSLETTVYSHIAYTGMWAHFVGTRHSRVECILVTSDNELDSGSGQD